MKTRAVVIPCFNEENRLNKLDFDLLVEELDCHLVFVDDGSTDNTLKVIREFNLDSNDYTLLIKQVNGGKAKAVETGLSYVMDSKFESVGIYDADGAINYLDLGVCFQHLESNQKILVASGARILLAGSNVTRSPFRRWVGRIIATIVSLILGMQVYDPQSPCKVYRVRTLQGIGSLGIKTRWFVDAELLKTISRIQVSSVNWFVEFPVTNWQDKPGSNLSISSIGRITIDLCKLVFRH